MPPIRSRNLPEYANRAGDPSFPPPYVVDEAGMDIFICEGDAHALENVIDGALNEPTARQYGSPGILQFELASSLIGFACIDALRMRSKPAKEGLAKRLPPGITGVYARQTEVAVMVQVRDNAGMPYWYLPYVLNNLPTAVTTGREIYGYPKQFATFRRRATAKSGGDRRPLFGPNRNWQTLTVSAYDLALPHRKDEAEAEFRLVPVLQVLKGAPPIRKAATGEQHSSAPLNPDDFAIYADSCSPASTPDTTETPIGMTAPVESVPSVGVPQPDTEFLERIRSDVPYVFLRQFREPSQEALASYQALVVGRLVPDAKDWLHREEAHDFSLSLPWAFNLALAEKVFGRLQPLTHIGARPRSAQVDVVGLLSGAAATFDVPRASVLWQFGLDNCTEAQSFDAFRDWRTAAIEALAAGASLRSPTMRGRRL
jgi:hypothetical protein